MPQPNWPNLLRTLRDDLMIAQSVCEAIRDNVIVPAMLPREITIEDVPGGKVVPVRRDKELTPEDLRLWALHAHQAFLAIWVLMLDQALKAKYGARRLEDKDVERRAVRCIVYMLRCAFAHSTSHARWEVSRGFQGPFTVSCLGSGLLTLDFAKLNGQPFRASQFGGWLRVIELLDYGATFA